MLGGLAPASSPEQVYPITSEGKERLLSVLVLCLSGLDKALPLFSKGGEYETYRWFRKSGETI